MNTPTPTNIELSTFINLPILLPWGIVIPLTFLYTKHFCRIRGFKESLAFAGQLFEALTMPWLISFMTIGALHSIEHGEVKDSWVGGFIIGIAVIPGLFLMTAYLITRHVSESTIPSPLSRFEAACWITLPWGAMHVWAFEGNTMLFSGYDNIILVFTPISVLLAFAIYRVFPRPASHILADLALINSIFFVVIALTYWLWGASSTQADFIATVKIGCFGLIVGPSMYQAAYLWSLTNPQEERIEIRTKNWHFLELVTVFYFFLFAPESLSGIANRTQNSEKTHQILREVRAHTNKTVIAINNVSLQPDTTAGFSGSICADIANIGQSTASKVTVIFEARLDEHVGEELGQSAYLELTKMALSRLEKGTTQSACGQYALLYAENNQPVNNSNFQNAPSGKSNWHPWILAITYTISYAEDQVVRPDYRGEISRH